MTDADPLAALRCAHGPIRPDHIDRGREAALAAWDAKQAAIVWAMDRSLDPVVTLDDPPPSWSDASTTTVTAAAATLRWLS